MTKQLIIFKIVSTTQILIDLKSNPAPTSSSQSCLDPSRLDKINVYLPTLTFINDYWKKHGFDYSFFRKVMSLLFNTLSRLVIAFLPRSKHFLVSWLQSPSTVILRSKKIKSVLRQKTIKERKYNVREYSVFTEQNEDYCKLVRRQFFLNLKKLLVIIMNIDSFC